MNKRRCVWTLLAAALLFGAFGPSAASASGRRAMPAPYWGYNTYPGAVYPYYYTNPYYYNPYVLPLPSYSILPSMAWPYSYDAPSYYRSPYRPVADGAVIDRLEAPPRMRSSLYPAIPFEKTSDVDRRRVRFEITVPFENAIVTFDGHETKQTGLKRVFVTPPMDEGKEYTVTITARWPTGDGTLSAPRQKTFTVTAGQTIQHTFIVQ